MDAAEKMDEQYRYQRYVYDWSRKYYLLGRDELLREIHLKPEENLLEIGCGTARNLLKLAYYYPEQNFYGLDASQLMLDSAKAKMKATLYENKITLHQGLAEQINLASFNLQQGFDHILFSYVLSMLPNWQAILEHAIHLLKPGGCIHIVDFSDQATMPVWFKQILTRWLAWFNVYPDATLPHYLAVLAQQHADKLQVRHLSGRYALLAHYYKTNHLADKLETASPIVSCLDF